TFRLRAVRPAAAAIGRPVRTPMSVEAPRRTGSLPPGRAATAGAPGRRAVERRNDAAAGAIAAAVGGWDGAPWRCPQEAGAGYTLRCPAARGNVVGVREL